MGNVRQMLNDIRAARKRWDETSMHTINGISNVSPSELSILAWCGEEYVAKGTLEHLKYLSTTVKNVLRSYNLMR